jgi:hypothetical protein
MVTTLTDEVAFFEEQKIRHVWWVMLLIYGVAALMWYGFIQQIILGQPFGTNPGPDWLMWLLWILFGIGLPLLFYNMTLIVEVRNDHLLIRYVPFVNRQIPFTEVRGLEARTYQPIKEYGGWGIRGWGNRRAYNVRGNQGVELELENGQMIMIGSQKPQELALAITSQLSA